ncbi:hypothetical protein K3495_g3219 [Podosphaera aphanis]|nr:hypothetical protein K3495_g3219 [Podosphaera aphanis]
MHQRISTTRLGQHKSTLSARHDFINLEISCDEAYTAANLAFNRAEEWKMTGDGKITQVKSSTKNIHGKSDKLKKKAERIKRQQSIRFTGPSAIQKRQLIQNRAKNPPMRRKNSSSSLTLVALSSGTVFSETNRPLSQATSIKKISDTKIKSSNITTDTFNEGSIKNHTSKRIWQSASSSYKRIRKSKSVFNMSKISSLPLSDDIPDSLKNYHRSSTTPLNPPISHIQISEAALRSPKSKSTILLSEKQLKSEDNDIAVRLAQDRFFHDTAQQLSRKKSSFLYPSRSLGRENFFRKSTHSSITNADLTHISSIQSQNSQESGFKSAAFKASRSLGNKFKKALGRSKDGPIEIPNQQVDAKEVNNRRFTGDSHLIYEMFSEVPQYDRASIARVVSRVPSICKSASNTKVKSHAGSIKSFKTDTSEDKSRAASWTSADVNTVTAQTLPKYLDQVEQCLSITNENDSRILSSPFMKQTELVNQFTNNPLTQPQCESRHDRSSGPISVNSARVYSALMKRLDLNGSTSKVKALDQSKPDHSLSLKSVTRADSSYIGFGEIKDFEIIKQVTSENDTRGSNKSSFLEENDNFSNGFDSTNLTKEKILDDTVSCIHQKTEIDSLERTQTKMKDILDDIFYSGDSFKQQKTSSSRKNSQVQRIIPTDSSIKNATQLHQNFVQEASVQNELQTIGDPFLDENNTTLLRDNTIEIKRIKSSFQPKKKSGSYSPLRASPVRLRSRGDKLDETPRCTTSEDLSRENLLGSAYTGSIYSCTTNGQAHAVNSSSQSLPLEKTIKIGLSFPSTPNTSIMNTDQDIHPSKTLTNKDHKNYSPGLDDWRTRISPAANKFENQKENVRFLIDPMSSMSRSSYAEPSQEKTQAIENISGNSQRQINIITRPLATVQQNDPNIQNSPSLRPTRTERKKISAKSGEISEEKAIILDVKLSDPPPKSIIYTPNEIKSISPMKSVVAVHTPDSTNNLSNVTKRNRLYYRNISHSALQSVTPEASPRDSVKLQRRLILRPLKSPVPSPTKGTVKQRKDTPSGSKHLDLETAANLGLRKEDCHKSSDEVPQNNLFTIDTSIKRSQTLQNFLNSRRKRIVSTSEDSSYFL